VSKGIFESPTNPGTRNPRWHLQQQIKFLGKFPENIFYIEGVLLYLLYNQLKINNYGIKNF
jgi:hypothetical protein